MSLFFDIPKVLQIDLLAHWLKTVDVAYLDSATTSHKYRDELLDLLSSPECILGRVNLVCMDVLYWVVTRKTRLSKICVGNTYLGTGELLEKMLKTVGPTLKHFSSDLCSLPAYEYSDESDTQQEIETVSAKYFIRACSRYCRSLESLTFCDGELDRDTPALITA